MSVPDIGTAIGDCVGRSSRAVRALRPLYAFCLHAAYGGRGIPWHVNGEAIRIDPRVRHLIPHENERPLFDFFRRHVRQGDFVLDVGAFLGTYAVMMARWVGENGRVVAFEPSPESFATVERHLRMNGLRSPRVEARRAAVGARPGRRELVTFADEPYRNMIAPANGASGRDTVEVVTVDGVCEQFGRLPDWIRMDVQGLEFEVLRGAQGVLEEGGGRVRIVAEMHPEQWPDYGIEPRRAIEVLADLGLRARPLAEGEPLFGQSSHVVLEPL
jgi:FkbM family methyltransferase